MRKETKSWVLAGQRCYFEARDTLPLCGVDIQHIDRWCFEPGGNAAKERQLPLVYEVPVMPCPSPTSFSGSSNVDHGGSMAVKQVRIGAERAPNQPAEITVLAQQVIVRPPV
jgi:hypothetical protein